MKSEHSLPLTEKRVNWFPFQPMANFSYVSPIFVEVHRVSFLMTYLFLLHRYKCSSLFIHLLIFLWDTERVITWRALVTYLNTHVTIQHNLILESFERKYVTLLPNVTQRGCLHFGFFFFWAQQPFSSLGLVSRTYILKTSFTQAVELSSQGHYLKRPMLFFLVTSVFERSPVSAQNILCRIPDDGGSKDLWNVGKLLPDCTQKTAIFVK
jgi:hypothetical protein